MRYVAASENARMRCVAASENARMRCVAASENARMRCVAASENARLAGRSSALDTPFHLDSQGQQASMESGRAKGEERRRGGGGVEGEESKIA